MEDNNKLIDKLEQMELGKCHEIMTDEVYMPCHRSRNWIRCTFICHHENAFSLYLEGSERFILKAIYIEKDFYISTDENFDITNESQGGFIAKLTQKQDSTFILLSNSCRYCDSQLGRYECCMDSNQREVLAKITHVNRRHRLANVDTRCTLVTLPNIQNGSRLIWCPRAFKSHGINCPDITGQINNKSFQSLGMILLNRLPEWDDILECLVLKFQGNRIKFPSAKNILLYNETSLSKKKKSNDDVSPDDAILQFGKSLPDEYILDFKYPLSPLQAFAIALTTHTHSYNNANTNQNIGFSPNYSGSSSRSENIHFNYHEAQNPKP